MNWAIGSVLFFSGAALGYLLHWRKSAQGDQTDAAASPELIQARFELDQHKQEVADFFEQSRAIMLQLGKDLEQAQSLWNDGAKDLIGEGQVVPLTAMPATAVGKDGDIPPNDYVQGSHGIIGKFDNEETNETITPEETDSNDAPPNDYVQGSHGIIGEAKKAANG